MHGLLGSSVRTTLWLQQATVVTQLIPTAPVIGIGDVHLEALGKHHQSCCSPMCCTHCIGCLYVCEHVGAAALLRVQLCAMHAGP